jgi:Zn-finger nucleic acid-binding protein
MSFLAVRAFRDAQNYALSWATGCAKKEPEDMKCPVCNVHLKKSDYSGVEYACCPECDGVWMEPAEFDRILEKADLHKVAEWNDDDRFEPAVRRPEDDECHLESRELDRMLQSAGAVVWEWDPSGP